MNVELVMIGSELLLGQIHDTNSTWLSRVLAEHGIGCIQKTTVGDNKSRIVAALGAGLDRGSVLLCSGGLGPTEDDITRESIAELLGRPLEFRPALYETIVERFASLRRTPTDNNKKQATLPAGATAIDNPNGTAPGLIVEDERGVIICMPGVPHELEAMMIQSVLPWLKARFNVSGVVYSRVLKVCGMGESRVDASIGDLMNTYSNPTIGLLASPEFVRIRITAKASTETEARALIAPVAEEVHGRLPGLIMGEDDDTLEGKVAGLLRARDYRISVTETCSGGLVAYRLQSADPECLSEGRLLTCDELPPSKALALDTARRQMLRSNSNCCLVCLSKLDGASAMVSFSTPDGDATWDVAIAGTGELARTRLTVNILENMRRQLLSAG